jgi:hypothetical protein
MAGSTARAKCEDNGSAGRGRISASAAVEQAREYLRDLVGRECESVSALQRGRDRWNVQLEVVELERIPRTTDILASYLVELDEQGELMSYERVARYYRNQASADD